MFFPSLVTLPVIWVVAHIGANPLVPMFCAIHDQVCAVASSGMPITLLLGVVVSCCSVHIVVVATALFRPFWDIFP